MTERELDSLYRDEALVLTRLAFLVVGRRDVAEEIVHDAFIAIRPRLAANSIANPGGYLRTSVVNGCRMWQRRQRIENKHQPEPPAPRVSSDDEIALHVALRRLPRRQREAIVLRYFADLPEADIAAHLGCRPATVRSLVRRAVAFLRKELA